MNEQKVRLKQLVQELIEDGGVEGPNVFLEQENCVVSGLYRVTYANAEKFIKDRDIYVVSLLDDLRQNSADDYKMVIHSTALLFAKSVHGLSNISVERNSQNEPTDTFPPVLPHELLKLRPFDFSQLVALQNGRLKLTFTEEQIIGINDDFKKLREAYRREDALKKIKLKFNHKTTFTNGWKGFVDRFPLLCQFVGGLASVFPGTSTVEADFSVIGWEKNEYRTTLTNFSLEGILYCKQYDQLKDISKSFTI